MLTFFIIVASIWLILASIWIAFLVGLIIYTLVKKFKRS